MDGGFVRVVAVLAGEAHAAPPDVFAGIHQTDLPGVNRCLDLPHATAVAGRRKAREFPQRDIRRPLAGGRPCMMPPDPPPERVPNGG